MLGGYHRLALLLGCFNLILYLGCKSKAKPRSEHEEIIISKTGPDADIEPATPPVPAGGSTDDSLPKEPITPNSSGVTMADCTKQQRAWVPAVKGQEEIKPFCAGPLVSYKCCEGQILRRYPGLIADLNRIFTSNSGSTADPKFQLYHCEDLNNNRVKLHWIYETESVLLYRWNELSGPKVDVADAQDCSIP